jgi:nicotinamide phosphoribosyltransferase
MSMKLRAIELIDWYKSGHYRQYPKGTQLVYSNFTPRSDRLAQHRLRRRKARQVPNLGRSP